MNEETKEIDSDQAYENYVEFKRLVEEDNLRRMDDHFAPSEGFN